MNWTKASEKIPGDFLQFFLDCFDSKGCLDPLRMNCFVECILGFCKTEPFYFRLECIGQVLPFALAYVEAPRAGLNPTLMGCFTYEPTNNPYSHRFRVLTYSARDRILCYGLDTIHFRFVQVGYLVWEGPKQRIAYCEPPTIEPYIIPLSRDDGTGDTSRVMFTAVEMYAMCMPNVEVQNQTVMHPPVRPPVIEISSDSDITSLSLSFEDDVSISDLGSSRRSSAESKRDRDPEHDPIEAAIIAAFRADDVMLEDFPEFVLKLKEQFALVAVVTDEDLVFLYLFPADCIQVFYDEMKEYLDQFNFHADRLLHESQVLCNEAIFLNRLMQYAHQANAKFPMELPQAQQAKYADLIALATTRHECVVEKTHIEACRMVLAKAHISSKFVEKCKQKVQEHGMRKASNIAHDHLEERLRLEWESCNHRRRALFGDLQAYYDDQVTIVQHIRDVVRGHQSRSPSPSLSQSVAGGGSAMDADA